MEDKEEIFEIIETPFFFSIRLIFKADRLKSVDFIEKKREIRVNHGLSYVTEDIKRYFSGERIDFNVPIDTDNLSSFTIKVLENLKDIKYGQTISYKELALKLGNKNLSRAVGNALRKNPTPIVIPCHRVIGSDGSLKGFMGKEGIKIKDLLLKLESYNSS